jgi:hypothetical protein
MHVEALFTAVGVVRGRGESKLSLCLVKYALCCEDIWARRSVAPVFLTLALDGSNWLV